MKAWSRASEDIERMDDIEYEGRARLARIRRDPEAWREVTCLESSDAEGLWTDAHAANRYALLLALQYDLQSDDRDLVRFLVEQEALRHRREPFQGLYPALQLTAFILASFQQIEHIWAFAQAKLANFDTYLGYDVEYLLSAGIDATLAYVAANEHPMREQVQDWLVRDGASVLTGQDLTAWWDRQREQYPHQHEEESPKARLDQALELGGLREASAWLQVWEREVSRTASQLHALTWYWALLQEWDRATALTEERLASTDLDPCSRAAGMVSLVEHQRRGGRPDEAWRTLLRALPVLDASGDWWLAGYGRSAIEEALLLAQTLASEKADAARGMPMDGRRAGSRAQGWRLCICWRSRWQPLPP
jgi:hypothetical protein